MARYDPISYIFDSIKEFSDGKIDEVILNEHINLIVVDYFFESLLKNTKTKDSFEKNLENLLNISRSKAFKDLPAQEILNVDSNWVKSHTELSVIVVEWVRRLIIIPHIKGIHKHDNDRRIGFFVLALHAFGSSINQAQKSVAQWLMLSETKVRAAYNLVLRAEGKISRASCTKEYIEVILSSFQFQERPFPKDFSGAYKAYSELKMASEMVWREDRFLKKAYKISIV